MLMKENTPQSLPITFDTGKKEGGEKGVKERLLELRKRYYQADEAVQEKIFGGGPANKTLSELQAEREAILKDIEELEAALYVEFSGEGDGGFRAREIIDEDGQWRGHERALQSRGADILPPEYSDKRKIGEGEETLEGEADQGAGENVDAEVSFERLMAELNAINTALAINEKKLLSQQEALMHMTGEGCVEIQIGIENLLQKKREKEQRRQDILDILKRRRS